MQTPGIAHVTARIREIQARVEEPEVPGHFKAVLDRTLESAAADPQAPSSEARPSTEVAMAAWEPVPTMTLGVMLGKARPAAVVPAPTHGPLPPFPGVATRAELEEYLTVHAIEGRNGRLGDGDLVPVSGGWDGDAALLPPAASAWEEMRAAAARDGVDLRVIDSYRTWESQARAHEAHLRGEKKANVLPPGTSEHGNGLAVDVTNGAIIGRDDHEWHWLQSNASRFGWYPISNETWHWEFRGVDR